MSTTTLERPIGIFYNYAFTADREATYLESVSVHVFLGEGAWQEIVVPSLAGTTVDEIDNIEAEVNKELVPYGVRLGDVIGFAKGEPVPSTIGLFVRDAQLLYTAVPA